MKSLKLDINTKKTLFDSNLKLKISNFLLELFFPSFCFGCQKEGTYLCQDCQSILEISEYTYCLCNQKPLRLAPLAQGKLLGKCGRCSDKKLNGIFAALPYKERSLTRKLIHQFKYEPYIKNLAPVLTGIIIEHLVLTKNNTDSIWNNSVLIPVPLEKKRLKFRGYNQAEELSKELSKILKVPVVANVLIKIKQTEPQIKLSAKERATNLAGAFLVRNIEEIKGKTPVVETIVSLRGKKIFLVDDVYTTGSTMEECATQLLKSGAKSVWGIALAREG